jgi:hypothetical protein
MWLFINDKNSMSISDQNEKGTGMDQGEAEELFKDRFRQKFGKDPLMLEKKLNLNQMHRSG